jgi:hypothetical protein
MIDPLKRERPLTTADLAETAQREPEEVSEAPSIGGAKMVREERPAPLFSGDEAGRLRTRWDEIQAAFVDEPRKSVEQADQLVAEAVKRLAEVFANERSNLESQWDRGDQVSTEDLRLTLQRYRSFFSRLLAV